MAAERPCSSGLLRQSPVHHGAGQSSTLSWSSINADSVSIDPGIGPVAKSGRFGDADANHHLRRHGHAGRRFQRLLQHHGHGGRRDAGNLELHRDSGRINAGQSSTLAWSVTNADSVSISSLGTVAASGSRSVSPTATTVYTLTATNASGSTTKTATITVVTGGTGPIIVFPSDIVYTSSRSLQLDATGSYSPSGNTPLSFYWTVRSDKAVIYNRTSSTPSVYLPGTPGNYIFDLTVTDSKGNSATKTLTVRLINLP